MQVSFHQSCTMYKFTVLKSDFATNVLLPFLKIHGTLTGSICNGVSFQDSYGWYRLESSNYLKGTLLETFILVFPETFKAAVFLEIAGNFFKIRVDST